jgi:hypothetical protein
MMHALSVRIGSALLVLFVFLSITSPAVAETASGTYRGTLEVVKFDVSPALRDIPPIQITDQLDQWGTLIVDPSGTDGRPSYGPQSRDEIVQSSAPSQEIPSPDVSFNALPNVAGFAPPDPVGDIGPMHYVAMSNVHFAVYDRAGAVLFGPAANNTLWSGFGGQCESQNAGDPVILYDQFSDRWLFTQFTGNAEPGTGNFYNCVALSQTSDPTGPWYRWQVSNGTLFPDYPKYGVGEEAYFISTRDFMGNSYAGIGAYAMNRAEMVAGNANPTIISFAIDRSNPAIVGDGLLPMDVDGFDFPPADSPHYYVGSQDDGGPYGAPQDALNVWEFIVDFVTPANSSFTLTDTVMMSPYDTIYPCGGGRSCIPQPGTANRLDHQGYRQRPLHRAAYRNFGTHESIVTLQSVEAAPNIAGMRWWELRVSGAEGPASWEIFQEGTYAPGVQDGIHRWFGSIAQDSAGNMGIGYSASNETTFPSVWYSGRLATDALGTMDQGEGVIVDGTGSQTGGGNRWGDYSSMNVDPLDDCTFWYVTEYVPVTSSAGWQLRVGAFRFDECGDPGFTLSVSTDTEVSICQGDEAMYGLNIGSVAEFDMPVTLSATGNPGGTSVSFDPNPVTPLPGTSTMTLGNTGAVAVGSYPMEITGMATGADNRTADVSVNVFDAVPGTPTLLTPADMATDVVLTPTFDWTDTGAEEYVIEVATDLGFSNIVYSETTTEHQTTLATPLLSNTTYYWRVRALNACGPSADTEIRSFTTQSLPGDCDVGETESIAYLFDFEDGAQGWVSGTNQGANTWTLSSANPFAGTQHWHVDDQGVTTDTFLTSPVMEIPAGLTNLTFRFWNYQHFETPPVPNCWDGGLLEVSTNGGGTFVEVPTVDMLTDPYDGPLQDASNPLQGRQAWCGAPQPYTDSRVDISDLAGESNVMFRFRVATDVTAGAPGWDIDNVTVQGCSAFLEFFDSFETPELP